MEIYYSHLSKDKTTVIYTNDEKELIKLKWEHCNLRKKFWKIFKANCKDEKKLIDNLNQRYIIANKIDKLKKTITKGS